MTPVAAVAYKGSVVVIGDDGTAWRYTGKNRWRPLPSVPGTVAAAAIEPPKSKKKSLVE